VPTVGGLLLFGTNRFARFPDAWVQAGRFAGIDRSRLIDTAEVRSFLPRATEDAISFVQKHLLREIAIENVRRKETWSVPPVAIREALINATVHADYAQRGSPIRVAVFDDRIEMRTLACFGSV
jgi:predicted HTH transcriptional regulator